MIIPCFLLVLFFIFFYYLFSPIFIRNEIKSTSFFLCSKDILFFYVEFTKYALVAQSVERKTLILWSWVRAPPRAIFFFFFFLFNLYEVFFYSPLLTKIVSRAI